jgi:hypothetical protein
VNETRSQVSVVRSRTVSAIRIRRFYSAWTELMAKCIARVLMPMRTAAEPAQNAFAPRNARGERRPREKPLEGAIL